MLTSRLDKFRLLAPGTDPSDLYPVSIRLGQFGIRSGSGDGVIDPYALWKSNFVHPVV
jgi:hypothetical protein